MFFKNLLDKGVVLPIICALADTNQRGSEMDQDEFDRRVEEKVKEILMNRLSIKVRTKTDIFAYCYGESEQDSDLIKELEVSIFYKTGSIDPSGWQTPEEELICTDIDYP